MKRLFGTLGRGRSRVNGPLGRAFVKALSLGACVLMMAMAFGVYVNRELALFLFLGATLALAFMTTTGSPRRPEGQTWSSVLLTALSLGCCLYFVFIRQRYVERLPLIDPLSPLDMTAAVVLVLLVLEATRRIIGVTLVLLVSLFLAYGAFGDRLSGAFSHRALSLQDMLDHLVFTSNGLFGPAIEVAAFLVFVFVVFGTLMDRWGGGDFFHDLANAMFGRQVGGPAKVAVFSSGLYGSISGSPTADVVTTGSFTIPLMIRTGISRTRAAAIEATSSTGGALLPPIMGSAAFLMVDFTGIAYSKIVLAAIVPALLYYLSVFAAVHFQAHRQGLKPTANIDTPKLGAVLKRDWAYFVPIGILVWGVLSLDRPVLAGATACAALVPIGLWRDPSPKRFALALINGLADGMLAVVGIAIACAVAGLVVGTLSMADLTGKISSGMFVLASGSTALTLIVASVVIILLGMGMPTPAVYALSAVLAAPALTGMGIALLPAHLFIVYFASMSAITPPVAVAAFAAASIAKENPMNVALLACRIGIVAFIFPFVFIAQPGLLLIGPPLAVVLTVAQIMLATLAIVAAIEGYLLFALGGIQRALLALLGIALLLPLGELRWTLALALSLWLAWMWATRKRQRVVVAG